MTTDRKRKWEPNHNGGFTHAQIFHAGAIGLLFDIFGVRRK